MQRTPTASPKSFLEEEEEPLSVMPGFSRAVRAVSSCMLKQVLGTSQPSFPLKSHFPGQKLQKVLNLKIYVHTVWHCACNGHIHGPFCFLMNLQLCTCIVHMSTLHFATWYNSVLLKVHTTLCAFYASTAKAIKATYMKTQLSASQLPLKPTCT